MSAPHFLTMSDPSAVSVYIESQLIDLIRRDKNVVQCSAERGLCVFASGRACVLLCDGAADEGIELTGEQRRLAEGWSEP